MLAAQGAAPRRPAARPAGPTTSGKTAGGRPDPPVAHAAAGHVHEPAPGRRVAGATRPAEPAAEAAAAGTRAGAAP